MYDESVRPECVAPVGCYVTFGRHVIEFVVTKPVRYEIRGDRSEMKWMPPIFLFIAVFFIGTNFETDGPIKSALFVIGGGLLYALASEFVFHRVTYLILHRDRLDLRRDTWGLHGRGWMYMRKWKLPYSRIISTELLGANIRLTYQSPIDGAESESIGVLEFEPRMPDVVFSELRQRIEQFEPQRDDWVLAAI